MVLISSSIALLVLWAAWKRPRLARILLLLVFFWAAFFNALTATRQTSRIPAFTNITFAVLDEGWLHPWFSRHLELVAAIIAVLQFFVGFCMAMKGALLQIGASIAIIMLLIIAPMGISTPYPSTIFLAIAMYVIFSERTTDFIWKKTNQSLT